MCAYSVRIEHMSFIVYDVATRSNSVYRMIMLEAMTVLASVDVSLNRKRTMLELDIKSIAKACLTYLSEIRAIAPPVNDGFATFDDSKVLRTTTTLEKAH